MRRRFHFLPLLITALWLPLQAMAGLVMPFCRHAPAAAVQQTPCHAHGDEASVVAFVASAAVPAGLVDDVDCATCEMCHLATAGYLLPAWPVMAAAPLARDFGASPALATPDHIPEPPQYPPRRWC